MIMNEGKVDGLTCGELIKFLTILKKDYAVGSSQWNKLDVEMQYCQKYPKSSKVDLKSNSSLQEVSQVLNSLMQTLPKEIQGQIDSIFFGLHEVYTVKSGFEEVLRDFFGLKSSLGDGFANLLWSMLNCSLPKNPEKLLTKYKNAIPIYRTTLSLFFIGGTMVRLNTIVNKTFGEGATIPAYTFWDF